MNKRIQELIEQTGMTLKPRRRYSEDYPAEMLESDNDYFDNNIEAVRAFFDGGLEELTQLIVRECTTTMLKESKWYWDKDEFESSNAILNAARRVKEHFGVIK